MSVRVLEFVTDFRIGGTERQVANLVTGLDPAAFEVQVGCFRKRGEFMDEVVARGIPLAAYPIRSLLDPRTCLQQLRLARDLRRWRIGLVRSYGFYPNMFVLPAAWLAGVPARIASIRDTGDHLTPRQRRAQRLVCRLAHHVVVNAEAVRRRLMSEGYDGGRISVIPNGITVERFAGPQPGGLRAELGLPGDAPLVVVLSRLNELKGIEYFLAAAAELAPRFPQVRFLVVGEGAPRVGEPRAYRDSLEEEARRLGLDGRVVFTGSRCDVPELLSQVTVSVLPSLTEGLSNVVLESMAAGTAVVATDVGGTPELITHGVHGLLVPPRSAPALAAAVGRLLADPALAARLGAEARRRVWQDFSLQASVRNTTRLYHGLLAARARGARGRMALEGRA
jgi:glycosyltransferase involved in cell wall biosynthesis